MSIDTRAEYTGPIGRILFDRLALNPSLVIVRLPGVEPGGTYIGQIRGFAKQLSLNENENYHISLGVYYPDRSELSNVLLTQNRFILPFALIKVPQRAGRPPSVWSGQTISPNASSTMFTSRKCEVLLTAP